MARIFGRMVEERDFHSLGPHEALAVVATGTTVSQPISITTYPPSPATGMAKRIQLLSRKKYGKPVAEVEAEIEDRRSHGSARKKPKITDEKWS
jgi:hypothetical protein